MIMALRLVLHARAGFAATSLRASNVSFLDLQPGLDTETSSSHLPADLFHARQLQNPRHQVARILPCWPGFAAGYAKKAGGKSGKGGKGATDKAQAASEGSDNSPEPVSIQPYQQMMDAAISHFQAELGKLHIGRASPGLLEPIEVVAHNERLPLKNYATVTVRNSQLLAVALYNAADCELVAAAIRNSPLKLQARVEGKEVLVPFPKPTLDTLKSVSKLLGQEAEKAKAAVRVARHKALKALQAGISAEDALKRAEKEVQKLADKAVGEVDRLRAAKDKEILEH